MTSCISAGNGALTSEGLRHAAKPQFSLMQGWCVCFAWNCGVSDFCTAEVGENMEFLAVWKVSVRAERWGRNKQVTVALCGVCRESERGRVLSYRAEQSNKGVACRAAACVAPTHEAS